MGRSLPGGGSDPGAILVAAGPWVNADRPLAREDLEGAATVVVRWRAASISSTAQLVRAQSIADEHGAHTIGVHVPGSSYERALDCVRHAILREGVRVPVLQDLDGTVASRLDLGQPGSLVVLDDDGAPIAHRPASGSGDLAAVLDELDPPPAPEVSLGLRGEAPGPTELLYPQGIDVEGERLVVADTGHHRVLVLDRGGTVQVTIGLGRPGRADGPFSEAGLNRPRGVRIAGERIQIADAGNGALREADLATGRVRTLARAEDLATASETSGPVGPIPWDVVALPDRQGWAVSLAGAQAVARVGPEGEVDRLAELSEPAGAQPMGLTLWGDAVHVADGVGRLLELDPTTGACSPVGSSTLELEHPVAVAPGRSGRLLVADAYASALLAVEPETGEASPLDGPGRPAPLVEPRALTTDEGGIYVADADQHLRQLPWAATSADVLEVRWREEDPVPLALDPVEIAPSGRLVLELVAHGADGLDEDAAGEPTTRGPLVARSISRARLEQDTLGRTLETDVAASGPATVRWTVSKPAGGTHAAAWRFPVLERPGAPQRVPLRLSTRV